ncbi:MAG: L,D-transpeptidase family protein [Flavobacteriales bacterium]|nr:L,D-transpeptidase family protein [Flavobacteriales bacterium]
MQLQFLPTGLRYDVQFLAALAMLASCASPIAKPNLAERAQAIEEVFETPDAYSVRTLDANAIARFIAQHPEYRQDSAGIVGFYQRRAHQYAWFVNDSLSQSAAAFYNLVNSADTAFREVAFIRDKLDQLMMADQLPRADTLICDECMERLELGLTAQFFRFADKKYGGTVGKDLRELDWFIPRRKKNYDQLLDSLVAGRMDLSPVEPLHQQYALLKSQLKRYRDLESAQWPLLSLGDRKKIEPGDKADWIPDLRQRLMLLGDFISTGDSVLLFSTEYDSLLVAAVMRFQERHGLHPDGVIGKGAIAQLNITPAERARTLLVNMERLRWVPEQNAPDQLLVNIPEFRLHVYEQDTIAWSMVVVVGAQATRTVIFSDTLSTIVFSPTWTPPISIIRGEILPAMAKDPNYLKKKGMEVVGGTEKNPVIRQKPGSSNALGHVKFLFPNSYSIYFHDTPSKSFFARESRAFSHGCIRLSEPQRFAEYLLREDSTWTSEKVKKAMHSGKEQHVRLKQKRPVSIGYFTAWVDRQGRMQFRDDVYGHDARLANELFAQPDQTISAAGPPL